MVSCELCAVCSLLPLLQVIKELRNTSYRDKLRGSVLASRQQTCLHPTVSKMPAGAANQACKQLVASRKCSFHNQVSCQAYAAAHPQSLTELA